MGRQTLPCKIVMASLCVNHIIAQSYLSHCAMSTAVKLKKRERGNFLLCFDIVGTHYMLAGRGLGVDPATEY